MAFNTFNFWIIYPFIFGFYWLIPIRYNQYRKGFLLLVSYLLYMNWKPVFAIVLLAVTIVTYIGGIILDQCKTLGEGAEYNFYKRKTLYLWCMSFGGLLPLLIFKYYNFINNNIKACLKTISLRFALPGLNWAIPVGISFFTFQAVGYMLDVYHGRNKAEKNLIDYMLFVSFFPQVVAGPISTVDELMPQIKAVHEFKYEQGRQGLKYLLWGMFIKLVVADRVGLFVDTVYADYSRYSGSTCLLASLFYSIQIYCDFSGYSLMAIGIARTLGFNLPDNFKRPYLAVSITDFWKRWHITLTHWLTRHVYIPLGGSRCGKTRTYVNILITFLVSGIWHGANWTFIIWGGMHGVLQIIEKALDWQKYEGSHMFIKIARIFLTFMLVNLAWIFFRMPNVYDAICFIKHIIINRGVPSLSVLGGAASLMALSGMAILFFKDLKDEFFQQQFFILSCLPIRWTIYVLLFCMIILTGVLDGGQFIYAGF